MAKILIGKESIPTKIQQFQMPEKNSQTPYDRPDFPVHLISLVRYIFIISNYFSVADSSQTFFDAAQDRPEITLHLFGKILTDFLPGGEK